MREALELSEERRRKGESELPWEAFREVRPSDSLSIYLPSIPPTHRTVSLYICIAEKSGEGREGRNFHGRHSERCAPVLYPPIYLPSIPPTHLAVSL